MSRGRFYAKRNGVELKSHPLNGATWGGTGPFIGYVNGYPVRDSVCVIDWSTGEARNIRVSAEEVQESPIMLQEWFPPGATAVPMLFVFATAKQIKAAGKELQPL